MKISIWIPKEKLLQNEIEFVQKEITEANNIKSKKNRKSVISALNKIKGTLEVYGTGFYYLSDGEDCIIGEYDGRDKLYKCDNRDYHYPTKPKEYS